MGYFFVFMSIFLYAMLSVYGYSYDFGRQQLTQQGIVRMDIKNARFAEVLVDGTSLGVQRFPMESNEIPVGAHHIVLQKEGYAPWAYSMDVDNTYVTDVGMVVLQPTEKGQFIHQVPYAVDRCVFSQEYVQALCVHEAKKLAYITFLERGREYGVDLVEINLPTFATAHWIDEEHIVFLYEEEAAAKIYDRSTNTWTERLLPARNKDRIATGIMQGPYSFFLGEKGHVQRYDLQTGRMLVSSLRPSQLRGFETELWAKSSKGWQEIHLEELVYSTPAKEELKVGHTVMLPQATVTVEAGHQLMVHNRKESREITRFAEEVQALQQSDNEQFVYVQTNTLWYRCHILRAESCEVVGEGTHTLFPEALVHMYMEEGALYIADLGWDEREERIPKVEVE